MGVDSLAACEMRASCLHETNEATPQKSLMGIVEPHYSSGKRGRRPIDIKRMLHIIEASTSTRNAIDGCALVSAPKATKKIEGCGEGALAREDTKAPSRFHWAMKSYSRRLLPLTFPVGL